MGDYRGLVAGGLALGLLACQPATLPQEPLATAAPAPQTPPGSTHPIAFTRVASGIGRDAQVGTLRRGFLSFGCASYIDPQIFWSRDLLSENAAEFSDKAFQGLTEGGFSAVGDPQQLFNTTDDAARATFQLGAIVTSLALNLCGARDFWTSRPNGLLAGTGQAAFQWQLYSVREQPVVFEKATTGTATVPPPGVKDGLHFLFVEAFGEALRALAADAGFRKAVAKSPEAGSLAAVDDGPIRLFGAPPRSEPADAQRWEALSGASVTVSTAAAHGSGAVVDGAGWVLTNAHVVGDAEEVTIGFVNGIRVSGQVVRRHKVRDVALVRLPVSNLTALPARQDAARVGEPVYAIGTPLDEKLKATLTAGVVSAWRTDEATGERFIQADVGIHAGSSGGPLLDASGNLLGIAVAGYTLGNAGVGINWFVPIDEALDALSVRISPAP